MKKVAIEEPTSTINEEDISPYAPIFAKAKGKLIGMVVKEERGWIVKIGRNIGAYSYSSTRTECIKEGMERFNLEFFVED
jgi:hypothetical protein